MTRHRVDQPTPRRVVTGIDPIPGAAPQGPHQHHRTLGSRPPGDHPPTTGLRARGRVPWRTRRPGRGCQRVTGDDGTLTSIVEPGSRRRIFTRSALRLPSAAPPQTTVLRFSPLALTVKETWSAVDTDTPETSARSDGSRDPSAPRAASTPALVTCADPELTSGTPSGALPTVRKATPSRSTTSTSPRGLRTASTATLGVTVMTTESGRPRPTVTELHALPASSRCATASVSTRMSGPPSGTRATARTCAEAAAPTPWTSTRDAVRALLNHPTHTSSPAPSTRAARIPATRRGRRRAAAARRSKRVRDEAR